jgi:hypothetical protein
MYLNSVRGGGILEEYMTSRPEFQPNVTQSILKKRHQSFWWGEDGHVDRDIVQLYNTSSSTSPFLVLQRVSHFVRRKLFYGGND